MVGKITSCECNVRSYSARDRLPLYLRPVDRHLKERLVGAAVLVAAAIILIPEMLSGPDDSASSRADLPTHEADANSVKTYTIDLNAPKAQVSEPSAETVTRFVETAPMPPPEESVSSEALPHEPQESTKPAADVARESVPTPQMVRERDQRLLEEFSAQEKPARPVEKPPAAEAPVTKPAIAVATQSTGAWAVQVASFGARATSDRMAAELKAKGFPAFVTAFAAKGQTMYRVRVGPVADRAAAEALLKKIKPLHPDAAVAPQ
jgi:DedD protein